MFALKVMLSATQQSFCIVIDPCRDYSHGSRKIMTIVNQRRQLILQERRNIHCQFNHALLREFSARFLRWTSNIEMAAGVTPEMRVAWPRVTGLKNASFCCTSADNPRTAA